MTSILRMCGARAYCNALRRSGFSAPQCPHCAAAADFEIAPRFEVYWHHPHTDRPLGQASATDEHAAMALAAEQAFEGGPSGFSIVYDCEAERVIAAYEGADRIDGGTL